MGRVTHLFLKSIKGAPMVPIKQLRVIRGYGIESDKNANPISPRQILITRKEDLDDLNIPYGGLRENIIVQEISKEHFLPGSLITIGDIQIRLTFYCEPCKRIAAVVPSMKAVMCRRGILGVILENGFINVDDNVMCIPEQFKPFSELPYDRFLNFMCYVPKGKVVTYKMITHGMGVAESFIRAMPKYIEKAYKNNSNLPLHRIVDENGYLLDNYVFDQKELLSLEGITFDNLNLFGETNTLKIDLKRYLWKGESIHLTNNVII